MDEQKQDAITFSRFACIGAGFSGICLGSTLKRWYGITDIRLFERHDEFGGTWYINKYPGCQVDIPPVLYSLSYQQKRRWSRLMASRDELLEYLKDVAEKYDLTSKITLNSTVERCEWIESSQRWRLSVRLAPEGRRIVHECQFLFGASGPLADAKEPDFPGVDSFNGPIFSATNWPKDLDTRGKKVILVGNGCTGVQVASALAGDVGHLTHFIRSKHWIVEALAPEHKKNVLLNFLASGFPTFAAMFRLGVYLFAELGFLPMFLTGPSVRLRKWGEEKSRRYMKRTAPEKYHDLLIPEYSFGCRRRIFDCGYLDCLHQDNITLTDDPILEVVPEGVRTKNGIVEADIIACATGYSTGNLLSSVEIIGRDGITLKKHWETFGGQEAYNTTSVSGFPNFFFILGPNTITGHTSTIMAIENNTNFALRVIKPILDGYATSVDVNSEAEKTYSDQLQADLSQTIWSQGGCSNWYVQGGDKAEWNSTTYPYFQLQLWYRCVFPTWKDFTYSPSRNAWKRTRLDFISRQMMKTVLYVTLFTCFIGVTKAARSHGTDVGRYGPFIRQWLQGLARRLVPL